MKLDEFNKSRMINYEFDDSPIPNNIECPECGAELVDSCPNTLLLSYPPQKRVYCEKCGFRGNRIS